MDLSVPKVCRIDRALCSRMRQLHTPIDAFTSHLRVRVCKRSTGQSGYHPEPNNIEGDPTDAVGSTPPTNVMRKMHDYREASLFRLSISIALLIPGLQLPIGDLSIEMNKVPDQCLQHGHVKRARGGLKGTRCLINACSTDTSSEQEDTEKEQGA